MDADFIGKNSRKNGVFGGQILPLHTIFLAYLLLATLFLGWVPAKALAKDEFVAALQGEDGPIPAVAIHVSELTQALENMPAATTTPHDDQTTGYEWWNPSWHYFTLYESIEEALRSDGTPFVEVSDADISAGRLLTSNGKPRFPILISLASEAVRDDEIPRLSSFVAAGGFLFAGSSAFTRYPDGRTRGDFALADEMGLHMATASLRNWSRYSQVTKLVDQRILADLPEGTLYWDMAVNSDQLGLVTKRQPQVGSLPFFGK